jgi:hypothetical protein
MIRIIMFRLGNGEWVEGVLHTFVGENAVVETKATGDLQLVPVKPENLKFKILTEAWIAMQVEAQRQAQSRSVLAGPPPPDFRR